LVLRFGCGCLTVLKKVVGVFVRFSCAASFLPVSEVNRVRCIAERGHMTKETVLEVVVDKALIAHVGFFVEDGRRS
jgi:hypothetical protein